MNATKMRMIHSAIPRSAGSSMASHFIEAMETMETAQRPKIVSASRLPLPNSRHLTSRAYGKCGRSLMPTLNTTLTPELAAGASWVDG